MSTYLPERSFTASLKYTDEGRVFTFDFSKLTLETEEVVPGNTNPCSYARTEEDDHLNLTTQPLEPLKLYFLCRRWDDGDVHYEIKARHSYKQDYNVLKNLLVTRHLKVGLPNMPVTSVDLYIQPGIANRHISGWRLYQENGNVKTLLDATSLKPGTSYGQVWLKAPTREYVGFVEKVRVVNQWHARASCGTPGAIGLNKPTPVALELYVHEVNIPEP
ncbi:hypothetical protein ASF84_25505 [Pseudomonas sp. Leaf127]|uniref:hypothetical protein n=1 Tax=Pseudomonas sp. Leaf127 TaxID=1736267 RepID=UPI000702B8C1|nr:hypothetical protein [Pseudomonas sp. Leaf127]KQQ64942.1 hypothetical protein ASF84_25505 [Pseudomonas sp. Leaf127]